MILIHFLVCDELDPVLFSSLRELWEALDLFESEPEPNVRQKFSLSHCSVQFDEVYTWAFDFVLPGCLSDCRMDIRPNHTIYINNVNDKVKKEGEQERARFWFHGPFYLNLSVRLCLVWFCWGSVLSCRAEALALRAPLSVWADHRHRGHEDAEDEGAGLRHLQRAHRRYQRPAAAAGLPLLQQAHGTPPAPNAAPPSETHTELRPVCLSEDPVRQDGLRGHLQDEGHVRRQREEEGEEEEGSGGSSGGGGSERHQNTISSEWSPVPLVLLDNFWVSWKDFSADGSDPVSLKVNWTRPPGSRSVNVSVFLCRFLLLLFRRLQLRWDPFTWAVLSVCARFCLWGTALFCTFRLHMYEGSSPSIVLCCT